MLAAQKRIVLLTTNTKGFTVLRQWQVTLLQPETVEGVEVVEIYKCICSTICLGFGQRFHQNDKSTSFKQSIRWFSSVLTQKFDFYEVEPSHSCLIKWNLRTDLLAGCLRSSPYSWLGFPIIWLVDCFSLLFTIVHIID